MSSSAPAMTTLAVAVASRLRTGRYDLRRSFVTHVSELDIAQPSVVEAIVNLDRLGPDWTTAAVKARRLLGAV